MTVRELEAELVAHERATNTAKSRPARFVFSPEGEDERRQLTRDGLALQDKLESAIAEIPNEHRTYRDGVAVGEALTYLRISESWSLASECRQLFEAYKSMKERSQ